MDFVVENRSAPVAGASSVEPEVLFRVVNRIAIISLNRPAALNALSHEMILELTRLFDRCRSDEGIVAVILKSSSEKAFCAGGDVRALYAMMKRGDPDWLHFFVDEYRLDHAIHQFPKPVVAIMDGITMGGGMGLGQGASLRVVTQRTKMAMPETRIGLFPDVGATYFLAGMPAELALYVGLTGATLTGADAVFCNLADICVPSDWLATYEERLRSISTHVGRIQLMAELRFVFEPRHNVVPHSPLSVYATLVRKLFLERRSVDAIADALKAEARYETARDIRQWLSSTEEALRNHSPIMLKVTRGMLRCGREMTLAECFRMELDTMARAIPDGDFMEGVRAHLIDKDRQPRWLAATLDDATETWARRFYAVRWQADNHPLADLT